MKLIITCEHGGNFVPGGYTKYFIDAHNDLNSHRGIDYGALDIFNHLVVTFSDFSLSSRVSRLLVDLNRSLSSNTLFSEYSQPLPLTIRKNILRYFYNPYRKKVEKKVKEFIDTNNKVVHLSVHTFTPVLNNKVRKNDIGILFDSDRKPELKICNKWKKLIIKQMPELVVMFNYPYTGTADGLTKSLREKFPENYAGIELEINQKFSRNNKMDDKVKNVIEKSLVNLFKIETIYKT